MAPPAQDTADEDAHAGQQQAGLEQVGGEAIDGMHYGSTHSTASERLIPTTHP